VPTLKQGIVELLKKDKMEDLLEAVNGTGYGTTPAKNVRYNSTNMLDFCKDKGKVPTIEFRQHEGTLNPDDVVQWIKTVVGSVSNA
jgi:hypothetical protein